MKKLLIIMSFLLCIGLQAKNLEPESYWDIQSISNPKISPNGSKILFSKRYIVRSMIRLFLKPGL